MQCGTAGMEHIFDVSLHAAIKGTTHGTDIGLPVTHPFISRARQCGACILQHT